MVELEPEMAVFECDESYFGGARNGKRGRGAAGKVCAFGILKRGGRVYAPQVADAASQTLQRRDLGHLGGGHAAHHDVDALFVNFIGERGEGL